VSQRHWNPKSAAARVVVSMHICVIIPAMTSLKFASGANSQEAESLESCSDSASKIPSPLRGRNASWIWTPFVPGRKKAAPGEWNVLNVDDGQGFLTENPQQLSAGFPLLRFQTSSIAPPGK